MLRTASTRTNPRSTPRTLTGGRPERLLDSTPVLFRLPTVDTLPLSVPDLPADAADTSASVNSTAAATVAVPQNVDMAPAAVLATALQATPSARESVARQPVQASTQPDPFDQPRSWWEHWSSGVVLILLILALLVVSILAMKRPASNTRELMADQPAPADDLVIPTLDPLPTSTAGGLPQGTAYETNALSSASRSNGSLTPGGLVNATPATVNDNASTTHSTITPAERTSSAGTSGISTSTVGTSTSAANSLSLVPGELSLSSAAESSTGQDHSLPPSPGALANDEPLSLDIDLEMTASADKPEVQAEMNLAAARSAAASSATLSPPIGIQPPALFSDVELQFNESLPVAPVANQTVPPTSGSGEPRLHDEAMALPVYPGSLSSDSQWAQPSQLPSDGNAAAASAGPMASLVSSADQPQFSTAEASVNPTPPPSVSSTAYPDLPADAIIRAWQKSKELNQAENVPANRYMPPATGTSGSTNNTAAPLPGSTVPFSN